MSNKKINIVAVMIIIIMIGTGIFIFLKNYGLFQNGSSKFIMMGGKQSNKNIEKNYIFTNYDDYYDTFKSDELSKNDFDNNNYAVLYIKYNTCADKNVRPVKYTVDGNIINVEVKYRSECGNCASRESYYLFKVDKSITHGIINVDYKSTNHPNCYDTSVKKPLIYLYPEVETNVKVKVGYPDNLTSTYPKYNGGWNVTAKPNGDLIDNEGRTYYGLYWEGINTINNNYDDGFVIKGEDTISFLEEKLKVLGLNEREANEFIIYWLPVLEKNKYNLIRFENIEVINKQMPLYVEPKPDTVIRVLMEYKPLNKKIDIKEQELVTTDRYGFSVVEWGGTLIQ